MKILIFLFLGLCLPFLSRFQETKVFENGRLVSQQSFYAQLLFGGIMIVGAIALAAMAWKRRRLQTNDSRKAKLLHFAPALFAFPASWQHWQVSQFGDTAIYTEIKAGLGGPMTMVLLLASAVLFVAIMPSGDRRRTPNKAPEPTTFAVTSRALVRFTEGRNRNVRPIVARAAPSKVVAHL